MLSQKVQGRRLDLVKKKVWYRVGGIRSRVAGSDLVKDKILV